MTIRRKLDTYIGIAVVVAALLVAFSVLNAVRDGLTIAVVPVLVLACVLVIGELRPIRISHGDGSVDEVTISSSFSLALVLTGPLIVALGAQSIATRGLGHLELDGSDVLLGLLKHPVMSGLLLAGCDARPFPTSTSGSTRQTLRRAASCMAQPVLRTTQ